MKQRVLFEEMPRELFSGLERTEMYLKKSNLGAQLQELLKYRVSQINGCAFCLDMHHKEAIHKGETEQRLHSLAAWRECPYYSEKERAALALAEALTQAPRLEVEDIVFDNLLAHFSKTEIAELIMVIAQINTWNRINITIRAIPGNYVVGQY